MTRGERSGRDAGRADEDRAVSGARRVDTAVDRRTVLAATAGIAGLAGCLGEGGGEAPTGDGDGTPGGNDDSGDAAGSDGGATATTAAGDAPPTECPMLPGSYATHDTGEKPLPVDFEYPAAMEGSWTFQNPDDWAGSNTIRGRVERGEDHDGDGDVRMTLAVRYRANSAAARDSWYDEATADPLTTIDFDGESVEFLVAHPEGPYAGEHNGWQARGMLPYRPAGRDSMSYFQAAVTVETLLFRVDAEDVTEACGRNQRDAVARTVESLSLNDATTFDQYVQY